MIHRMEEIQIVWFKRDLRIVDHALLGAKGIVIKHGSRKRPWRKPPTKPTKQAELLL